jgi:hypothetical protein
VADGLITNGPTESIIRLGQPFDFPSAANPTRYGVRPPGQQPFDAEAIASTLPFKGLCVFDETKRIQSLEEEASLLAVDVDGHAAAGRIAVARLPPRFDPLRHR